MFDFKMSTQFNKHFETLVTRATILFYPNIKTFNMNHQTVVGNNCFTTMHALFDLQLSTQLIKHVETFVTRSAFLSYLNLKTFDTTHQEVIWHNSFTIRDARVVDEIIYQVFATVGPS